jgi:voltage-gated potassium channel
MSLHVDDLLAGHRPSMGGAFRFLRYAVLVVGLVAMTAMTVPDLGPTRAWLEICLWACLAFFATELVLNAWPRADSRASGYLFTGSGLIDLLAVVPVPLALLAGVQADTAWLLGSLWLLKLAAAVPGLSLLGRVIALEARPLASVLVIFLIVLLLGSVALYVAERAVQPDRFGSLPQSLWWAVTTLTTTGYGDAVPVTFAGRLIAGLVMICGLGVFGLWTGILATGFATEHRRREFVRNWNLVSRVPFLRDLDPAAMTELTRLLRRIDLGERTVVVRRGRPGDCMYFIAAGEVEVQVEPQPVRLGAGAFFGEIALLEGGPRTATVVTTAPSTLLILELSDFRAFTAMHPDLARAVEKEAASRASAGKTRANANT